MNAVSDEKRPVEKLLLRLICLGLSSILIVTGGVGMVAGVLCFTYKASPELMLGSSGLVAGAVLMGTGAISLTLCCRTT